MPIARSGFELLFLHARLLPELALAQMAQDILAAPRDGAPVALAGHEEAMPAPGDAVDWFGTSGLSEAALREIRAAGERELANFAAAPRAQQAVNDAPQAGEALDLAHELALAYARRDAIAPLAAAAFERVDTARLDALLADVAGAVASLTEPQDTEDIEVWLMLVQDGDPALAALLRYVQDSADGG